MCSLRPGLLYVSRRSSSTCFPGFWNVLRHGVEPLRIRIVSESIPHTGDYSHSWLSCVSCWAHDRRRQGFGGTDDRPDGHPLTQYTGAVLVSETTAPAADGICGNVAGRLLPLGGRKSGVSPHRRSVFAGAHAVVPCHVFRRSVRADCCDGHSRRKSSWDSDKCRSVCETSPPLDPSRGSCGVCAVSR